METHQLLGFRLGSSVMALIDYATLTQPVADTSPCGPDLDLQGDAHFLNLLARVDGLVPQGTYFVTEEDTGRLVPFRPKFKLDDEAQAIGDLLRSTRDLRLLTILAKFTILSRDLANFALSVDAIAHLLKQWWDDVHPRADDGDFTLRMVTIQTLDESPTVVQPLQYVHLVPSRRFGSITYRNILAASGKVVPREEEEVPDLSTVEAAFREADLSVLRHTRDHVALLKDALARIQSVWVANVGYDQAISFPKLAPVVAELLRVLDDAITRLDPTAPIPEPTEAPAHLPNGSGPKASIGALPAAPITSAAQATIALAAAEAYFSTHEPSSPALLLIQQAQRLMGRSFNEVLEILLPTHLERATFRFGADPMFELPIHLLAGNGVAGQPSEDAALGETADPPLDTAASSPRSDQDGATSKLSRPINAQAGDVPTYTAQSRQEATVLLQQVGAFYRLSEPASPVPLLTDRACAFTQKDFLTLLKDVLPGLGVAISG
ncbi:ImpA family type VI secretion system protein [Microvirga pakistanensis]|uniref:type VI secretion system protein TssA n=1 Tax=Microvirga pakistanensis TaxID=1682650 RepID=UPI00106CE018|nr:type VI secretion system ImpA family N-terminal domain-containing protein [Microvirga pakistanensis]